MSNTGPVTAQDIPADLNPMLIINELSVQVANYAKDNAVLKATVRTLQDQIARMQK